MKKKNYLFRKGTLGFKTVFVDGLPGNGKSMISSIISTLKNFEKTSYLEEFEAIVGLYYLKKIDLNTAKCMADFFLDFKIYNQMMGRDVNFRKKDISGIFNFHSPSVYKKRLNLVGNDNTPLIIKKKKPILNLAIHHALPYALPILQQIQNKVLLIEILRHPAYLIKQMSIGLTGDLFDNLRNFTVTFKYKEKMVPYYAQSWKVLFCKLNNVEKSIFFINEYFKKINKIEKIKKNSFLFVVFENFVKNPQPFINKLCKLTASKKTIFTKKFLKINKIPRIKMAESKSLDIYKKLGWKKPIKNFTEKQEIEQRLVWVKKNVSKKMYNIFLKNCKFYEKKYWSPE